MFPKREHVDHGLWWQCVNKDSSVVVNTSLQWWLLIMGDTMHMCGQEVYEICSESNSQKKSFKD